MTTMILSAISTNTMTVTSSAFKDNGNIPSKYTCEGQGISPSLTISSIPVGTKTLALILFDPDAQNGKGFLHWLAWNIPPASEIKENARPGVQGKNGKKESGYTGPCPPSGTGVHHYNFSIYALDTPLDLPDNASREDLEKAIQGHVLATGKLTGLYRNSKEARVKQ